MLQWVFYLLYTTEEQALGYKSYDVVYRLRGEVDRQLFLFVVTGMSSNYWLINMNGAKCYSPVSSLVAFKTSSCR